jgi:hypothetical protein
MNQMHEKDDQAAAGAAIYSKAMLSVYMIFMCSASRIVSSGNVPPP